MRHHSVAALLLLSACAPAAWCQSPGGAFRPFARVRYSSDFQNSIASHRSYGTSPTTVSTSTSTFGPDPVFLSDLADDDGDGITDGDGELGAVDLYALGYGSVQIDFTLSDDEFLRGYRDYANPPSASPWTTTGPILYVGNTGSEFTDINVIGLNFGVGVGAEPLNTNDAAAASAALAAELAGAMTLLTVQTNAALIHVEVDAIEGWLLALGEIDPTDGVFNNLEQVIANVRSEITMLNIEISNAPSTAGVIDPGAGKTEISDELTDVNVQLNALNILLGAVDVGGGAGTEQQPAVSEQDRLADDLNGNGSSGVYRVRSDIDGDGTIEPGEIVALINNFGDLHTFNVFFDEVTVRSEREVTSFELMKQHVLFGDPGHNTSDTGWRFEMFQDAWSVGFGDEVAGVWGLDDPVLDTVRAPWLRESLRDTRFSLYSTAGLRSLLYDTDFYFEGRGSILGRTWVDQSVDHASVGPQVGLGAVVESSIFRFEALALGMAGYGRASYRQVGVFGEEAIPGALNRSSTARETYSNSALDEERLAWHGETRLTAGCQLTQNLRLDATWRWFATGPVQHAADATQWAAPDFGIQPADDVAYSNDWFFGATYTR